MITKAATDAIERVRADYVPAPFEGSDATVEHEAVRKAAVRR